MLLWLCSIAIWIAVLPLAFLFSKSAPKASKDGLFPLAWRLRVVALDTGKVALDEP